MKSRVNYYLIKGDTNVRVFELYDNEFYAGMTYSSSVTQKGIGVFPKR